MGDLIAILTIAQILIVYYLVCHEIRLNALDMINRLHNRAFREVLNDIRAIDKRLKALEKRGK
jgi:hypothetical protein